MGDISRRCRRVGWIHRGIGSSDHRLSMVHRLHRLGDGRPGGSDDRGGCVGHRSSCPPRRRAGRAGRRTMGGLVGDGADTLARRSAGRRSGRGSASGGRRGAPGARRSDARDCPESGPRCRTTSAGRSGSAFPRYRRFLAGVNDQTIRMVVRTSLGGRTLRVRFANAFAGASVRIGAARIARSAGDGAIDPATSRLLTFNGRSDVTMYAGQMLVSDDVDLSVPALADVAVSLYIRGASGPPTEHRFALRQTYVSEPGDFTAAAAIVPPECDHRVVVLAGGNRRARAGHLGGHRDVRRFDHRRRSVDPPEPTGRGRRIWPAAPGQRENPSPGRGQRRDLRQSRARRQHQRHRPYWPGRPRATGRGVDHGPRGHQRHHGRHAAWCAGRRRFRPTTSSRPIARSSSERMPAASGSPGARSRPTEGRMSSARPARGFVRP